MVRFGQTWEIYLTRVTFGFIFFKYLVNLHPNQNHHNFSFHTAKASITEAMVV